VRCITALLLEVPEVLEREQDLRIQADGRMIVVVVRVGEVRNSRVRRKGADRIVSEGVGGIEGSLMRTQIRAGRGDQTEATPAHLEKSAVGGGQAVVSPVDTTHNQQLGCAVDEILEIEFAQVMILVEVFERMRITVLGRDLEAELGLQFLVIGLRPQVAGANARQWEIAAVSHRCVDLAKCSVGAVLGADGHDLG
jgi:hypothetical protein